MQLAVTNINTAVSNMVSADISVLFFSAIIICRDYTIIYNIKFDNLVEKRRYLIIFLNIFFAP